MFCDSSSLILVVEGRKYGKPEGFSIACHLRPHPHPAITPCFYFMPNHTASNLLLATSIQHLKPSVNGSNDTTITSLALFI